MDGRITEDLLRQMIRRKYEVNFNLAVDIRFRTEKKGQLTSAGELPEPLFPPPAGLFLFDTQAAL